jgi:hypothetical protein
MKARILIITAVFSAISTLPSGAQQLNWGAPIGTQLIDSNGDAIDDSFVFELGAFALNFDPTEANVGEWLTHWRVFDALTFHPVNGFSTSTLFIGNGVTSGSPHATDPSFSFAGLDAYMWIRKGSDPVPGSEWFVGRAIDWEFPLVGGDCCATNIIQWSVSDLGPGELPEWGRHYDESGPGHSTFKDPLTDEDGMQTHTFIIPEPTSALLLLVGCSGFILRRQRQASSH